MLEIAGGIILGLFGFWLFLLVLIGLKRFFTKTLERWLEWFVEDIVQSFIDKVNPKYTRIKNRISSSTDHHPKITVAIVLISPFVFGFVLYIFLQ